MYACRCGPDFLFTVYASFSLCCFSHMGTREQTSAENYEELSLRQEAKARFGTRHPSVIGLFGGLSRRIVRSHNLQACGMCGMCATSGASMISVLHPAASDGKPAFATFPSSRFLGAFSSVTLRFSLHLRWLLVYATKLQCTNWEMETHSLIKLWRSEDVTWFGDFQVSP